MAKERFAKSKDMKDLLNPYSNVASKIHAQKTICWHITEGCNLNCSFCEIRQNKTDSDTHLQFLKQEWPSFKEAFNKMSGEWEIFLMGGEPLSLPGIFNIVEELVKQGHKISLATNMSFSTKVYERFLDIVGNKLCLLFGTFKPEYYKPEPFLKKAEYINRLVKKRGGQFGIGAVAERDNLDYLYTLGFLFRERNITFKLQGKKEKGRYIDYNKEEIDKIKTFGKDFGLEGNNCFKGRVCLAGIYYFVMDQWGNCFRCHDSGTKIKNNPEYLGKLTDDSLRLFNKPKVCPHKFCSCVNAYNKGLIL